MRTVPIDPLFQPFRAGRLALGNRFAMAPMTRSFARDGVVPEGAAAYYARRARGGAGLIITEGTAIEHPAGHYSGAIPWIYGDAPRAAWRRVVEAVHEAGSAIFVQLWHCGLQRFPQGGAPLQPESISPSGDVPPKYPPARPMTERDMAEVIDAYAAGAEAAKQVGFDGVEVHAAHGYLLDQFFSRSTNKRLDGYGGDMAARARLAVEVLAAMRRRVGPDFPLVIRTSQWKGWDYAEKVATSPAELEQWLVPLAEAGVSMFHVSTRRFWLPEPEGSPLSLAGWTRKLTGRPTIAVGSVGSESPHRAGTGHLDYTVGASTANLSELMRLFEEGQFDLVAIGRALLANPEWPQLVRQGRYDELRTYSSTAMRTALECSELM